MAKNVLTDNDGDTQCIEALENYEDDILVTAMEQYEQEQANKVCLILQY